MLFLFFLIKKVPLFKCYVVLDWEIIYSSVPLQIAIYLTEFVSLLSFIIMQI